LKSGGIPAMIVVGVLSRISVFPITFRSPLKWRRQNRSLMSTTGASLSHLIFRIAEDVPELRLHADNLGHEGRECLFVQALGGRYHGRMTLVTCSRSGEVRQNPMHKYGI
jgi:hypothetical protein